MRCYGQVKGRRYDTEQPATTQGVKRMGRASNSGGHAVIVDGALEFPSISQAALHLACDPSVLSTALKSGKDCCGHKVRRA